MLFKKRGVFTVEDARKVIKALSENPDERDVIIIAEHITEEAKRRLWDYVRGIQLIADMTGEERSVRVEILEGFVSDKVKGLNVEEL
ncbi:hypothetical protein [Thermococcus sp.]|uniref:hypothetical protein n=1 Tax=Thermococcus sp. TaxID=35749 RepID=UPI0025F705CC|nr:hypothetical protein [Thermococcus sp.]